MKYLITGMNGGLGNALSENLKRNGHECVAWQHFDPIMPEGIFDAIIHLAGKEALLPLKLGTRAAMDDIFTSVHMLVKILAFAAKGGVQPGGSIIVMSSVAAVCGTSGMSLYSGAKGAMESMVRSAAIELAPQSIRINAIRAGGFLSPMHYRIAEKIGEKPTETYMKKHPIGIGDAWAVIGAIKFLLENDWSTGSILTVDGGYSAQ